LKASLAIVLTIYVKLTSPAEYNAKIISEFRANEGRVGGEWEGTPLLLLHHVGAKSGKERVTPMGYLADDPRYLVIASNGGAPKRPDWYHNLKAQPNVSIEVGAGTVDVTAAEETGEERELLFRRLAERYTQLSEFERKTPRVMPVITLTPR
jgi:deazaflavin-dependent oxidoreductase (nitroreductase family)